MINSNIILPSTFKQIQWLDTNYPSTVSSTNIPAYILTDIVGISGDKLYIEIECIHRYTTNNSSTNGEWNFLIGAEYNDNETNHIKVRRFGSLYSDEYIYLCGTGTDSSEIQLKYNISYNVILNGSLLSTKPETNSIILNAYNGLTTTPLGIGGCELVKARSDGYRRVWKGLLGKCIVKYDSKLIGEFIPTLNL